MVKSETEPAENLPRPEVEESRIAETGNSNPEPEPNAIPSGNNEVAESDPTGDDKKLGDTSSSTMQLTDKMATTPKPTSPAPPTTTGGPQNLHHSPGSASTSSSSSSSSSNTGYTRQSNPRPRAHKHSTGSATGNGSGPIISSLPPSAISAAPYIPTSMVHQQPVGVDYHHGGHNHPPPLHHIHHLHHPVHIAPTYAYMPCPDGGPPHTTGPPPHGIPPPPLNPGSGTAWINPYYPGPIYDSSGIPTFVHHVTPPTPSATTGNNNNAGGTGGSGGAKSAGSNRMSPAPQHLVQHPAVSSAPTFCQNHSPAAVSSAGAPVNSCPNSSGLHQQPPQQQHVVSYHLQQGEVISLQLGDGQVEVIQGRTNFTITIFH